MTLLALLRHGETRWSRERRIQGRTDIPLSDEGKARLAGCALPGEWLAGRVVSSPLRRCLESASSLGIAAVDSEDRLAEMSWGEWEGRRLEELRAELGDAMHANEARGLDFTPPGGETPRQVFERVRPFLAEVAAGGKPTLAISHRGVIRAIFAHACDWDMLGRPPLKLDWGAIHVFRVAPDGMPAMYRMNVPLPPKNTRTAAA